MSLNITFCEGSGDPGLNALATDEAETDWVRDLLKDSLGINESEALLECLLPKMGL